ALAKELHWEEGVELLKNHSSLPRDNRGSRFALNANREPVVRPDLTSISKELQSEVTRASHANLKRLKELIGSNPDLIFSTSTDDELAIEACSHVGTRDIIRYHLDHGAPLSLPTAVSLGDREMIRFLLKWDPTLVHERGAHDFPVMWYVVMGGGGAELAELLLEHGVSVDQQSKGATALHWCVMRKDLDFAHWLIENGADVEAIAYNWTRDGQTPLQLALAKDADKFVALLKQAGASR
ncbi:MAG: ankyrin repeat protein, partial [Candidatus Paceibacteria bacterium]